MKHIGSKAVFPNNYGDLFFDDQLLVYIQFTRG